MATQCKANHSKWKWLGDLLPKLTPDLTKSHVDASSEDVSWLHAALTTRKQ